MDGEIERIEQEILRLKGELVKARRAAPAETVSDYTFVGPGAETVTLSSLFGDKRDLLVVHNIGRECPYCSLWADSMNGMLKHIQERTAFVLDSPDDWQTQQRFAQERGWKFAMVSSPDATFRKDMGYQDEQGHWLPGVSAFHKQEDGTIVRVGHSPFGPGDDFCPVWPLFDLFPDGAAGWEPA